MPTRIRIRIRAALFLFCSACNGSSSSDAGVDSAPVTSSVCPGKFGAPTQVMGVNSTFHDVDARLSPDELTIYLASDRADGLTYRIYSATRPNRSAPFGTPVEVTVATLGMDGSRAPSITADGLALYWASGGHIWIAQRASASAPFGVPSQVTGLPSVAQDGFVRADGTVLYFTTLGAAAIQRGVGKRDVFGSVTSLDELPVATMAVQAVTPDDLLIVWSGQNTEAWSAHRTSTSEPFTGVAPIAELAGRMMGATPSWISADGCTIYFSGSCGGPGGAGWFDVCVATKKN